MNGAHARCKTILIRILGAGKVFLTYIRNPKAPAWMAPSTRHGNSQGANMTQRLRQRGFTLIELMVVISIIVILLSLAIPNYSSSILHAKETALHDDLYTMRSLIDQYTLDKQKAPQSLDDLVQAGYL